MLQDKDIPDYVTILRIHGPFLFGMTDKLADATADLIALRADRDPAAAQHDGDRRHRPARAGNAGGAAAQDRAHGAGVRRAAAAEEYADARRFRAAHRDGEHPAARAGGAGAGAADARGDGKGRVVSERHRLRKSEYPSSHPYMDRMRLGKWMMTFVLAAQAVLGFVLDWAPNHLLNPQWHGHARFHGGLLLFMVGGVSATGIWLLWRKSKEPEVAIRVAGLISISFWTPFFYVTFLLPRVHALGGRPGRQCRIWWGTCLSQRRMAAVFLVLTSAAWRLSRAGKETNCDDAGSVWPQYRRTSMIGLNPIPRRKALLQHQRFLTQREGEPVQALAALFEQGDQLRPMIGLIGDAVRLVEQRIQPLAHPTDHRSAAFLVSACARMAVTAAATLSRFWRTSGMRSPLHSRPWSETAPAISR